MAWLRGGIYVLGENLPERDVRRIGISHRCVSRSYAKLRFRLTNLRTGLSNYWAFKHTRIEAVLWFVVWVPLALATSLSHAFLHPFLENENFVERLNGTALQIGAALLGASAIVASLVLFAMQVNVERLPHGLFRRLSTDKHLLSCFAGSFMASIIVACLPLIVPLNIVEWAILAAAFLTFLTLRLFLAAYRRALALINPVQQLLVVVDDTAAALKRWGKQADWYLKTLAPGPSATPPDPVMSSTVDTTKAAFLLQNDWGGRAVRQGLNHCMAVYGRAASQDDHDVAEAALRAIVRINAAYLRAKGRTFFAENGFIEVPFATDPVINQTLEQLKREFRTGLARRDEEHVNMLIKAYGDLAQLYMQIDYGRPEVDPWHAALATGYLIRDIKSVIPHNLPDCLMQGIRTMGGCALALLNRDKATDIVSIVDELGSIGAAMAIREDHRPITATAMQQLAGLTYHMINAGVFDPGYSYKQIGQAVELTAKVVLSQPNPPLSSVHRTSLGPFFSSTTQSSLGIQLKGLANALLNASADDARALNCIGSLHEWAERSRPMAKQVLILALEKGSPFAFDILHWIGDIVAVLLMASRAPASKTHYERDLEDEAGRWASLLSWIPDDRECLDCAATWSAATVMFNVAGAARACGSEKVYTTAQGTLLRWAMQPARREDAWHDVGEAMLALVAIAIRSPTDEGWDSFKARLHTALQAEAIPSASLIRGAAAGLRRAMEDYEENVRRTRGWDHVLISIEHEERNRCLVETAGILEAAAAR